MMRQMKTTRVLPAAAVLLLLSGCATTESMDGLGTSVQQAQSDAREAMRIANEALASAQRAEQRAQQAEATANAANQRSIQTDQKIDEMFRRTMLK